MIGKWGDISNIIRLENWRYRKLGKRWEIMWMLLKVCDDVFGCTEVRTNACTMEGRKMNRNSFLDPTSTSDGFGILRLQSWYAEGLNGAMFVVICLSGEVAGHIRSLNPHTLYQAWTYYEQTTILLSSCKRTCLSRSALETHSFNSLS